MTTEAIKQTVSEMLKDIERYNPDHLSTLQKYVEVQAKENTYDLDANLAVLKLYQLNPLLFNEKTTCTILLKALTNLPHTDFVLCKCLLNDTIMRIPDIAVIMDIADILEQCHFQSFWKNIPALAKLTEGIVGFNDSIRKFVCHVVGITFQTIERSQLSQLLGDVSDPVLKQWVKKYGWKEENDNLIFIANQEGNIKTKNITEKIDFENIAGLMAVCN